MNIPRTFSSAGADRKRAERLRIARRIYKELAAQDPDRVIVLRDGSGRMVAHHDLEREQRDPEIAS
jgi:hypothetical protein